MSRLGKRYTVADIVKLGKRGVFAKHDKVEVLNGTLFTLIPTGKRHRACVNALKDQLQPQLAQLACQQQATKQARAFAAPASFTPTPSAPTPSALPVPAMKAKIQRPVYLNATTSPLPDVALVDPRNAIAAKFGTVPETVLLIIEVSYTSLGHDTLQKLPVYAAAGVPETWIVNLLDNVIEVYLEPQGESYEQRHLYPAGAKLFPSACPELILTPLCLPLAPNVSGVSSVSGISGVSGRNITTKTTPTPQPTSTKANPKVGI